MSLNAATIELLIAKGLTALDLLEVARAMESKADPTNAERQARFRAKKKAHSNGVTVTALPPNEYISNPQPVSDETVLAARPKSGSKRGTRLADDFEAPDDWIEWAIKKRGWSRADAIDEAECFARYWQAKPGREACKLDWPKTWQNWVANSRRQPERHSTGPPDFMEQYGREMQQRKSETTGETIATAGG